MSPSDFRIWIRWFWLRHLRSGMTKRQISLRFGRPEKTKSYPTHEVWIYFLWKRNSWRDGHAFVFRHDHLVDNYFLCGALETDAAWQKKDAQHDA